MPVRGVRWAETAIAFGVLLAGLAAGATGDAIVATASPLASHAPSAAQAPTTPAPGTSPQGLPGELVGPPTGFTTASPSQVAADEAPVESALGTVVPQSAVTADSVFEVWSGSEGTLTVALAASPTALTSEALQAVTAAVCEDSVKSPPVSTAALPTSTGQFGTCSSSYSVASVAKPTVAVVGVLAFDAAPSTPPSTAATLLRAQAVDQFARLRSIDLGSGAAPHKQLRVITKRVVVLVAGVVGVCLLLLLGSGVRRSRRSRRRRRVAPLASAPAASAERLQQGSSATVLPFRHVGWHENPADPLVQHYWDGSTWTRTITWDLAARQWVYVELSA